MDEKRYWFFSWVAYDSITGEKLLDYSGSDIYASDVSISANQVFESLINDYESRRDNLKIHCIAFNPLNSPASQ